MTLLLDPTMVVARSPDGRLPINPSWDQY